MPLATDLAHPSLEDERKKHKKKRLVQSPNSYFMDVKCPAYMHAYTMIQLMSTRAHRSLVIFIIVALIGYGV